MSTDVLCAGIIVADLVSAPIPRFPTAGGLELTPRLELAIGGCAANVAVDLTRLGRSTTIAGRIGDDALGRFVLDALTRQGVATSAVSLSTTAQTSATMVVNIEGEDRRFIHTLGANAEFTGAEISDDVLKSTRAVYVGGFGLNAALSGERVGDLFRRARDLGVLTVLDVVIGDPAPLRGMLEAALPWTDLFIPNEDEARLITGADDPQAQAAAFRAMGVETAVITCGNKGSFLLSPTEALHASAFPVETVDATGGGDAFLAGFLDARLQGKDSAGCLNAAAALGASCVRQTGATTGVFRRDELDEYLRTHSLTIDSPQQKAARSS